MEQRLPVWMVSTIIFFALCLATTFGMFLFNHGTAGSLYEQWVIARGELRSLDPQLSALRTYEASLAEPIHVRLNRIENIRASNNEEQVAIREMLLPQHSASVGEVREHTRTQQETMTRLLGEARRAQSDLQREEDSSLRAAIQLDEDILRLRDQIREQSQALERIRKENREELLALEGQIQQRQDRVRELTDRIDSSQRELTSDGQLLRAHAHSGFVIINRGRAHNLLPNTRFTVYNQRGGRNIIKGEIEVHEIQGTIAVCRVISEHDPNDPLIPGDHIHNRTYRPDEVKRFVVAGEFAHYNSREIAQFIREGGGQVDSALSTRTHYLVAGDGAQAKAALEQASLLGVTVLSENQAVDMVRHPLRFQVRQGMTFAMVGDFDPEEQRVIRDYLRASGGTVINQVRDGLHVLIAGENAAEAIAEARMLGARVVTHNEMRHVIGSPRSGGR